MNDNNNVLFDSVKNIKIIGEFNGSIISKFKESLNSIIFSDNIIITDKNETRISDGLNVGIEEVSNKQLAFSKKSDFIWENIQDSPLEYSIMIPGEIMELFDEGQFSDAFPYTINMLHTAGLYLKDSNGITINHLDFFQGEILNNPVSLIFNGICVADRVVIDHRGDPVFYDCLIVGRDENDDLRVSYEPLVNVKMDFDPIKWIIILGIENLKI
ncbi:MAG: hypothetical protein EU539_05260 [Promethearchaeota archaeon]|nr:MAG: hypothetical protein EU539_05260 [Candidatus Lokiarchaeota archaeon]